MQNFVLFEQINRVTRFKGKRKIIVSWRQCLMTSCKGDTVGLLYVTWYKTCSHRTMLIFLLRRILQRILHWWIPHVSSVLLHSCDYLKKISIKTNMVTDEDNSRNETWNWTNDETRVTVQRWFFVGVELMAYIWYIYIYIYMIIR